MGRTRLSRFAWRVFLPWLALACALACAACASPDPAGAHEPRENWQVFRGAWFEVRYPAHFQARPSLPSTTAEGFDSVEFIAPDGSVSFYVFAPQWGGEPTDIELDPLRERLVAEEHRDEDGGHVRWFTIAAKDGSYLRSYRETTKEQGSLRTVVGIKYASEAARRRYLPVYEEFRRSLEQYTD